VRPPDAPQYRAPFLCREATEMVQSTAEGSSPASRTINHYNMRKLQAKKTLFRRYCHSIFGSFSRTWYIDFVKSSRFAFYGNSQCKGFVFISWLLAGSVASLFPRVLFFFSEVTNTNVLSLLSLRPPHPRSLPHFWGRGKSFP
jgi:hypothetical protein